MRYGSVFILIIILISALTPVQVSLQQGVKDNIDLLVSLDVCNSSTEIFSGQPEIPAMISCSCVPSIPAPVGVLAAPAQHFKQSLIIQQRDRPPQA